MQGENRPRDSLKKTTRAFINVLPILYLLSGRQKENG